MTCLAFDSPLALVQGLSDELLKLSLHAEPVHVALSGGSTPKKWFDYLAASHFREDILWSNIHFWWVDERFVPASDPQSNFGESQRLLWEKLAKGPLHLHPFSTTETPSDSVDRYQKSVCDYVPIQDGLPRFDWVLLGVGEDGHTASLFPGQTDYQTRKIALACKHPESGQDRLTLSAKVIEAANRVSYVLTGESKAQIFRDAGPESSATEALPASMIRSRAGQTDWFVGTEVIQSGKREDEYGS